LSRIVSRRAGWKKYIVESQRIRLSTESYAIQHQSGIGREAEAEVRAEAEARAEAVCEADAEARPETAAEPKANSEQE
jgi:hypothetical protein